jgi:hypothetical protein
MIYPEQTTNLVRGQGFRSNNSVLQRFVANGDHQKALDYFGFEGTYVPGEGESLTYKNTTTGATGIRFRDGAFGSYSTLLSTYTKESYHLARLNKGGWEYADADVLDWKRQPEERLGVIHQYKNRGLYYKDKYPFFKLIKNVETRINNLNNGFYNTPYYYTPYQHRWWHVIYRIPRLW